MNVVKCALHFTENVRQHFTYPSKTSPSPSASSTSRYMTECCSPEKRAHVIVLTESKVPNNHHQFYGVLGTFPNPRPFPGLGFFMPGRTSIIQRAVPFIDVYLYAYSFLDNDLSGKQAFSTINRLLPGRIHDMSNKYEPINDLNDYLVSGLR